MTEHPLELPELKDLFDEVEARPVPRSDAVLRALEYWHTRCDARAMPDVGDIQPEDIPDLASNIFIYDQIADGTRRTLRLAFEGDCVKVFSGAPEAGAMLMDVGEAAYAHRVFELARLALDRGEPVGGTFHDMFPVAGERVVELMVAPLADENGRRARVFGAIEGRVPGQA